jgi:hypothetical protein
MKNELICRAGVFSGQGSCLSFRTGLAGFHPYPYPYPYPYPGWACWVPSLSLSLSLPLSRTGLAGFHPHSHPYPYPYQYPGRGLLVPILILILFRILPLPLPTQYGTWAKFRLGADNWTGTWTKLRLGADNWTGTWAKFRLGADNWTGIRPKFHAGGPNLCQVPAIGLQILIRNSGNVCVQTPNYNVENHRRRCRLTEWGTTAGKSTT